jgi:putative ABC transport system permease protein
VGRRLAGTPGVAAAAPVRYLEVKWLRPDGGDERLTLMATDPAAYSQVTRFVFSDTAQDPAQAVQRLATGNAVFVSSVLAEKHGLQPGGVVRLSTEAGPREFMIAAVVVDFYNQGLVLHTSWADLQRYYKERTANAYLLKVAPGYEIAEVRQRLDRLYGRRDRLTIESNQAIIQRVFTLLAQANSLFDVLALIAMLVAALGVVNTLTMSVIERTQEIGMLRSVGMRRRQVVLMILAEAGLMGVIGGVLGLVFGLALTRLFLFAMTAMSGYRLTYVVPWQGIITGLAIAWLVSQVAALLPARRAARISVLEAIHYE